VEEFTVAFAAEGDKTVTQKMRNVAEGESNGAPPPRRRTTAVEAVVFCGD